MRIVLTITIVFITNSVFASGGSNLNWYKIKYNLSHCEREPYGIIYNYDKPEVRSSVRNLLRKMKISGQDRLRIAIFHGRNISTGTVIPSNGGNFARKYRSNLKSYLYDIKQSGFREIEVGFFPQGKNNPSRWDRFSQKWSSIEESYFQENWNLIYNLTPIIANSGIPFRIDLGNELSPPAKKDGKPYNFLWSEYVRKMWLNFTLRFPKTYSVGFSIPVSSDIKYRIKHLKYIYSNNLPYLFDIHVYDNPYYNFISLDNYMNNIGIKSGVIVGESYYNDIYSAYQLRQASRASKRTIYYLAQWPLRRNSSCNHVDIGKPIDFNSYRSYGF